MYDLLSSIGGITVRRGPGGVELQIRGQQSALLTSEPLFVLNGVPIGRGFDRIGHLNPVQITEITVKRSLASTNRWGSEGNSGAILIKTKGQN